MGKKSKTSEGKTPVAATPNVGAKGKSKAARKGKGTKKGQDAPRAKRGAREGKQSGLDAAAKVLAEAGEPLSCRQIVERAFEKNYWRSGGKTPHATIYSAILREIQKKGDAARFKKACLPDGTAARGRFELKR